jgi:zinc transporter ZupT
MVVMSGVLAVVLALAHVLAAWLPAIADRHRQVWTSFAGGVAVAYVFVYIVPELVQYEEVVARMLPLGLGGKHVFLVALVGLCSFYAVERLALRIRGGAARHAPDNARGTIFWMHIGSFAVYNALVGYLLVREFDDTVSRLLYTGAVGLHFLGNDYALEQRHLEEYRRRGRWILAVGVLAGWAIATVYEFPHAIIGMLFAFLAGGIMVNVLKEELPEERKSRLPAFLVGAAFYTGLLLALE